MAGAVLAGAAGIELLLRGALHGLLMTAYPVRLAGRKIISAPNAVSALAYAAAVMVFPAGGLALDRRQYGRHPGRVVRRELGHGADPGGGARAVAERVGIGGAALAHRPGRLVGRGPPHQRVTDDPHRIDSRDGCLIRLRLMDFAETDNSPCL